MKLLALVLTALPLLSLANPIAEAEAEPELERKSEGLEKRARTCKLTGCDVRYRTGPGTNYPAPGQISGCGKSVSLSCYKSGGSVNGYPYWDKIASGQGAGYYISEYYIDKSCAGALPAC